MTEKLSFLSLSFDVIRRWKKLQKQTHFAWHQHIELLDRSSYYVAIGMAEEAKSVIQLCGKTNQMALCFASIIRLGKETLVRICVST